MWQEPDGTKDEAFVASANTKIAPESAAATDTAASAGTNQQTTNAVLHVIVNHRLTTSRCKSRFFRRRANRFECPPESAAAVDTAASAG